MRRILFPTLLLAFAAVASPACGGDDTPGSTGPGGSGGVGGSAGTGGSGGQLDPNAPPLLGQDCDPISTHCGLPFPSDVYLIDDASTPTGKRVRFGRTTLPRFAFGPAMDPALWDELDGFSPGQAPMAHFDRVSPDGFPTPESIPESLAEDARTILIEADTGLRIPHWVDLDYSTRNNGLDGLDDERAFMLRPAVHLKHGTRYIVALRGLRDYDDALIEPSPVFQALRDGTESSEPSVGLRREHYARLFSELEAAGVTRSDLQLAWDYTTASREVITGKLIRMRDLALEAVGEDGPEFTVKSVEDDPNPHIKHRVILTMSTPLFLNHARDYSPDDPEHSAFHRDEQGRVAQNGMMEFDVLVHIPHAASGGQPLGLLQNGHGLFGRKTEGQNGYLAKMANDYGWLAFATDLYGFCENDVPLAVNALGGEPRLLHPFVARQHQGHINQLMAMRMMLGRVARDGIVHGERTLLAPGVVDRSLRSYRGDSQGGIMGAVYMAISTDVTRGLLGETGFPYNLLLNRSKDWAGYGFILDAATETALDIQVALGVIQMLWDQTEPSGYVNYLAQDTLPGTPAHRVLIHSAIGDHQVSTYAAQLMARSIGAKSLLSNDGKLPREVWGVEAVSGPITEGSALVEFDFNLAPEPLINIPPRDGCDPHDRVRILTPSYQMQDEFFRTGAIRATCDGVCNCDGPAEEEGCAEMCR